MKVQVIKPFGVYSVGTVIPEMFDGQARTLIARGLVREVSGYETKPEPVLNRMMRPRKAEKVA